MRYYLYGAAGGSVAGLLCWWFLGRMAREMRAGRVVHGL